MTLLANEVDFRLEVRAPIGEGALLMFPVFVGGSAAPDYVCGPEIEASGIVAFHELDGGADVPQLVVENGGDVPLLLIEGETLLGAKQNRTLNTSVMCAPGAATTIPVSCLEAGRWGAPQPVTRSPRHAPPRLRGEKTRTVGEAAVTGFGRESDQGLVWQTVASYADASAVASPTSALEDVYDAVTSDVASLVKDLQPLEGQRGVVVAAGGRLSVDLFDKASTLSGYWDALVAGYATDAIGGGRSDVTLDDAQAFVERVLNAEATPVEATGEGTELHIDSDDLTGFALRWEGAIVHLAAFDMAN